MVYTGSFNQFLFVDKNIEMYYRKYIKNMKDIQNDLLEFLGRDNDEECNLRNLFQKINKSAIQEDKSEFKTFLYLISSMAKNHHRSTGFINRITQILHSFQNQIKQTFSNYEIFHIFRNNLQILLFLLKENVICIDSFIATTIKYKRFFYPELKPFNDLLAIKFTSKYSPDDFDQKRIIGENDKHVCSLIRDDLIDQFIDFINKNDFSLNSKVANSLFETNLFLLKNESTLIEYAAFYGSIQIFKYLYLNKAQIKSSLPLYSIHSNSFELIHIIEELGMKFDEKCFKEAIKCHHNDIANYIQNNYLNESNFTSYYFKYFNFEFFPDDLNHERLFKYSCEFDYSNLVKFLIKTSKEYLKNDFSPFQLAANKNNNEIIDILLFENGKKIESSCFKKCSKMKTIKIPSFITSIGEFAFAECSSLIQIEIPSSVTSIESNAFYSCKSLKSIEIPQSITILNSFVFNNCSFLTSIKLPSTLKQINDNVFKGCVSLENISIPSSVVAIGDSAFQSCLSLKYISIPKNVLKIGKLVFYECTSLKEIHIPSHLNCDPEYLGIYHNVYYYYII